MRVVTLQIHTILRQVADKTKTPLLELYQKIIWPLYRTHGHAFDAIQQAVSCVVRARRASQRGGQGLCGADGCLGGGAHGADATGAAEDDAPGACARRG